MSLTPDQCRAARGLLNLSRPDLAGLSGMSLRTIAYFEDGKRQPVGPTLDALRQALEKAGVVFIDENGGGPGVRLPKAKRKASKK